MKSKKIIKILNKIGLEVDYYGYILFMDKELLSVIKSRDDEYFNISDIQQHLEENEK